MVYFKSTALWVLSIVFFLNLTVAHAQFLESLLGTNRNNVNTSSRDDILSLNNTEDELTFEEVICRDIETFPKLFHHATSGATRNVNLDWITLRMQVM